MNVRNLNILLVEDNYGDERLVREALHESNLGSKLNVVRDGISALLYLRKEKDYAQAKRPDVIFLDLNLPNKSGLEVLTEIKADPDLESIPVLMLTTSDSPKDQARCAQLRANDYFRKPVDLNDFLGLITSIEIHWTSRIKSEISLDSQGGVIGKRVGPSPDLDFVHNIPDREVS